MGTLAGETGGHRSAGAAAGVFLGGLVALVLLLFVPRGARTQPTTGGGEPVGAPPPV